MPIRTMVVDDTVIWRKILSDSISAIPELELISTASNGSIALKKISRDKPDLIFLDIHMPEMDGIELLKLLHSSYPEIAVIMISGGATVNSKETVEALQSGAIDFICKPTSTDHQQNVASLQNDLRTMLRLIEVRLNTRKIEPHKTTPTPPPSLQSTPNQGVSLTPHMITRHNETEHYQSEIPKTFSICVIGVSTGGPDALARLIPKLPVTFPLPILVVQHMPPLFTKSLAESLDRKSQLHIIEASENTVISTGNVYIAPGGKHMIVRHVNGKAVIGLNEEPPENSCRPSVDVLFRSVAANFGDSGVLAIVLTGMGCDGLNGVKTLKRKKCYCITQSEASCIVYGMPRAVDEAKLADRSLPLEEIASEMESMTRNSTFRNM
ncbi:MAG: chemotaxis-specific protein-glutamate methyltransferase CheB [Fibrobacter sp.]|nr:chemotaxis-specific protein-glutamate methyltransferase CheB [Fibrobacter sp.]